MNTDNLMWWTSSMGRIDIQIPAEYIDLCSHQGECYHDCDTLVDSIDWSEVDPEDIIDDLLEYGCWERDDLTDERENRIKILWLACGNLAEKECTA